MSAAESDVIVTQDDVDNARRIVLDCMATDLLSGERPARRADRSTVYQWLGRVQALLLGKVSAAPHQGQVEPSPQPLTDEQIEESQGRAGSASPTSRKTRQRLAAAMGAAPSGAGEKR
jgi:hypothetical protein